MPPPCGVSPCSLNSSESRSMPLPRWSGERRGAHCAPLRRQPVPILSFRAKRRIRVPRPLLPVASGWRPLAAPTAATGSDPVILSEAKNPRPPSPVACCLLPRSGGHWPPLRRQPVPILSFRAKRRIRVPRPLLPAASGWRPLAAPTAATGSDPVIPSEAKNPLRVPCCLLPRAGGHWPPLRRYRASTVIASSAADRWIIRMGSL